MIIYIYTKNNEKRKSSLLLRYAFHRCCGSSGIAKCFYWLITSQTDPEVKIWGTKRCGTCPYLKQGKEFTFSATNETFRIKHSMNCTSTNLIYVITCAGCGHNYIGETGDVLRNRVTVHKQQIRDPHTRMLGVSKHIDECAAGLTPQFTIFPFYKILSISTYFRDRDFIEITKPKRTTETR